jgi:hypothetical protein
MPANPLLLITPTAPLKWLFAPPKVRDRGLLISKGWVVGLRAPDNVLASRRLFGAINRRKLASSVGLSAATPQSIANLDERIRTIAILDQSILAGSFLIKAPMVNELHIAVLHVAI